jgi:ribonuclease HII
MFVTCIPFPCSAQRDEIFERLIRHPSVRYSIGIKDHHEIDTVNILQVFAVRMNLWAS